MGIKNNVLKMIVLSYLPLILFGCPMVNKDPSSKKMVSSTIPCPQIFYKLPDNLENTIFNELKDRKIIYAYMYVSDADITTLSLKYSERSSRAKTLMEKSNRILILRTRKIPLLFRSDLLFADEDQDTTHWIQDFNFATYTFDEKGNVIDKIKF